MSTFTSLRRALIEQTREIRQSIEQEDTHRLLRHLKRRSTLLHKLNAYLETCSEEREKAAGRELILLLQERDQQLQADLIQWQQSISQQQVQQKQQQRARRQIAHAYRQPAPMRRAMLVT